MQDRDSPTDENLHYEPRAHEDALQASSAGATKNRTPAAHALERLAAIAPGLKTPAELRLLLTLTATAIATGTTRIRASSRALADSTKCGRRNVQTALDLLTARGIITSTEGTARQAATYVLKFLEVTTLSGVDLTPLKAAEGGVTPTPGVTTEASIQRHRGVNSTPPPYENARLPVTPSRLDIDPDRLKTLDRVLTARSAQIPRDRLMEFRELVTHMAAKHGRTYERPPDNDSMAALVQACDGRRDTLNWLVLEMHREQRQPGESPIWWTTVALQRIHGISAHDQAIRRYELRRAKKPQLVDATTPTEADELDAADFQAAILKLAAGKAMGG